MRTGAGEGALAIDTEMGGMAQADGGPDGANDNDASIPVSEDVPISGTGSDLPASDEGDDDNDNEDSDEEPPSEAGPPSDDDGDVYKDRSRPSKGLVLRARTQHKKGKLRMKKKFHTLTKKPPPLRQASPDTPLERGYLNFGPEVDDAAERKRNRDRMRTKQRNLKKQIAANLPPPPPLLPSKVPKDTQLNTNFVTLIGSAILAHPLRHAPVSFITEWLKCACPEKWGDHVKDRRPNWKSAVSSVLSQYDCFLKREVYLVDSQEKPSNQWTIKDAHLPCWHPSSVKEPYPIVHYNIKNQHGPLKPLVIPTPEPYRFTPRGTYLTEDNEEKGFGDIPEGTKAVLHYVAGAGYHLTLSTGESEEEEEEPEPVPMASGYYPVVNGAPQPMQFLSPPQQMGYPGLGTGKGTPQQGYYPQQQQWDPANLPPGYGLQPQRPSGPPKPVSRALKPYTPAYFPPPPTHLNPLYHKTPSEWARALREDQQDMEVPDGPWTVPIDEYRVQVGVNVMSVDWERAWAT